MFIFAQIEGDALVQFVAFNTQENAEVHISQYKNAKFITTDFFGSPLTHKYDVETGRIIEAISETFVHPDGISE